MRLHQLFIACTLGGAAAITLAANGLTPPDGDSAWPRWQARFGWAGTGLPGRSANALAAPTAGAEGSLRGATVLGDYYLARPASVLANTLPLGGLRATGGLLIGQRLAMSSALLAAPRLGERLAFGHQIDSGGLRPSTDGAVPYFGIGYTGLSPRHGLSVSADIGLLGLDPGGAVRLGRPLGMPAAYDDRLRELRLTPVLQLGVNYAF